MSTATSMTETESLSATTGPPIAMLLPLLQPVLAGSSLALRFGSRFLLTALSPLHILWSVVHAFLSPIFIAVKLALDFALFTPFSIIRVIAVALYPVYVFVAVACILGAAVGILGHYISNAILSALARSAYFTRSPTPPPSPHVTLRKRKRKATRLQ